MSFYIVNVHYKAKHYFSETGYFMNKLTLCTQSSNTSTTLSNVFIDEFMPLANGEFVKIYLYLLRCVSDSQTTISVSALADFFNQTEADVIRALRYWDKAGAIMLTMNSSGSDISGITFCELASASGNQSSEISSAVPEISENRKTSAAPEITSGFSKEPRSAYTPKQITDLSAQDDFSMLLYAVGTYLGGTLSSSDASSIAYFYDTLQFSPELIEYLVEYCVSNGHKSMRYIEKVALAWAEKGISSVKEAKASTSNHNEATYSVLGAFGITNRAAGKFEQDYIKKWTDVYCFDSEIIVEACNRTLKATHQPSFEYADTILKRWKEADVKNLSDIKRIDIEFEQNQQNKSVKRIQTYANAVKTNNRFNNFSQRSTDIDSLESALISNNG